MSKNSMDKSTLVPYLRPDLDILFIGLNPAKGSNLNGHYFSVKQAFWNQLLDSGLICSYVDKGVADDLIFGDNKLNYNNWNYGITDLVTQFSESNSKKIKPTLNDCHRLKVQILKNKPKVAILLHNKVLKYFLSNLFLSIPASNSGHIGRILHNSETEFYNVAFPHGNSITSKSKVIRYNEIKKMLINKYKQ